SDEHRTSPLQCQQPAQVACISLLRPMRRARPCAHENSAHVTANAERRGNADHGTDVGWPGSDEKVTTSRSSGMTSRRSNGSNAGAKGMVPLFGGSPRVSSQMRAVSKPTRSNRSETYGVLSAGQKVGGRRTRKGGRGCHEKPQLANKPDKCSRREGLPAGDGDQTGLQGTIHKIPAEPPGRSPKTFGRTIASLSLTLMMTWLPTVSAI